MSWWEEREGLTAWHRAGWIQHSSDAFLNSSQTHVPFFSLPCLQTLPRPRYCDVRYLKEAQLTLNLSLSSPTTQAWFTASMKERRHQQAFMGSMPSFISLSHPGG